MTVSRDPALTAGDAAEEVRGLLARGARFVTCYADSDAHGTFVRYVVDRERRLHHVDGYVAEPLRALGVPAARWHEREIADRWHVALAEEPDDASPLSPAVAEAYREVVSPEVSTVLYGPVRSGVSESVRWIIETAGEDFIAVAPSFGFKHRGLERRFVGVSPELAPFVAEHVSGATACSHAAAFSWAAEAAIGIQAPPRAGAARSILVELERIHQHLDAFAKLADDASLSVGAAQTYAAKERVHRLLGEAVGNRFGRGTICIGGMRFDAFAQLRRACDTLLDTVETEASGVVDALFATPSWIDRLVGTGRLSREIVEAFGGVGPVARGSGVACDARADDGWLFTAQDGDEALADGGDALARAHVRRDEILRSFRLVRNALDAAPGGPVRAALPESFAGEAMARVESPQGELLYAVRFGDGLARVAIRSASFQNWPLFVPALAGWIFTDFSFIEHSFGLIVAETDR
jgi:Ni,Fe-hydrogenase III large subunit